MTQKIVVGIFVILVAIHSAFGATITGNAPYLTISGYNLQDLNTKIQSSFTTAITQANQDLAPYHDQDKLATGFVNANLYSTNSATHQGFQNYSLFAITTGVMIGVQAPSANIDYYTGGKIEDDIKTNGDLYAGVAGSVSLINIGINAGFLFPGLYINGKCGKFNSAWVYDSEDFSFNTFLVGAGLTYSLFDEVGIGFGFLRWRGLTVGSGVVYQTTAVSYKTSLDTIYEQFSHMESLNTVTGNVVLDPSFNISMNMYTISVPFEINTAVQLLWLLNLSFGAGVDIVTGNADLVLKAASNVTIDNVKINGSPTQDYTVIPGNLRIDGATKGIQPSLAHARVMTGIGFNLGPVKLDVPIIYYFNYGAAVGVTVGFVW